MALKEVYFSYKEYMRQRYKEPLFSVPVDVDFGCPNRAVDGSGGCTFCPEHGVRSAQTKDAKNIEEQIQKAIAFAKKRYKAKSFSLYLQAYTGTFASVLKQKEVYEKLLSFYPFKALHVGTRPDCLSEQTLDFLQELNQKIDVYVELGVQSMSDKTLFAINRGHDKACSIDAIERLHVKGLKVFAHIIVGLPDEERKDWLYSVDELVKLGIDGIKIHNLHIIEHTQLASQYTQEPFKTFDEYEYAEEIIEILRRVPSSIPIVRLSTDTPKRELIAPLWKMQKGQFGEYIAKTMHYRGIKQGDEVEVVETKELTQPKTVQLEDGSVTFWSEDYRDYYHPKAGAYRQARELFVARSGLKERLENGDVRLLDIGFGMGYNTLEALKISHQISQHAIHVSAIEQNRMLLKQSVKVVFESLHVEMLESLFATSVFENINFLNVEARYGVRLLNVPFDVIFLDPFLESNNASIVTLEFFQALRKLLKPDGVLVASTSLHVSQIGLRQAGFDVSLANIEGSDIKGIVAKIATSSSFEEGIPYRDSDGVRSDKEIESQHQKRSLI
ncbi:MAG: TIGR01212 family radical SAM protein [Sulfurospirillaceae bacterium]|nr:TIGR01212 family radical SAM protein [Sulfurospirillaceae bacterium]